MKVSTCEPLGHGEAPETCPAIVRTVAVGMLRGLVHGYTGFEKLPKGPASYDSTPVSFCTQNIGLSASRIFLRS